MILTPLHMLSDGLNWVFGSINFDAFFSFFFDKHGTVEGKNLKLKFKCNFVFFAHREMKVCVQSIKK